MTRRPVLPTLAILLALAPAASRGADPAPAAGPRVLHLQILPSALAQETQGSFTLPQLRLYDRGGRQVADFGSELDAALEAKLSSALDRPRPSASQATLAWELGRVLDAAGRPVDHLPPADFTLVQYWASWCTPCRRQAAVLARVLAARPDLVVNLLEVEADPQKSSEGQSRRTIELSHGAAGSALLPEAVPSEAVPGGHAGPQRHLPPGQAVPPRGKKKPEPDPPD